MQEHVQFLEIFFTVGKDFTLPAEVVPVVTNIISFYCLHIFGERDVIQT